MTARTWRGTLRPWAWMSESGIGSQVWRQDFDHFAGSNAWKHAGPRRLDDAKPSDAGRMIRLGDVVAEGGSSNVGALNAPEPWRQLGKYIEPLL